MTDASIGAVVIGRNEGARLVRCLESVRRYCHPVVYVDSGSTDGSVAAAAALGANVVELDVSIPFTAARARNAGFAALMRLAPQGQFVQFVDGDCEMVAGWVPRAVGFLGQHPQVAVVCGRRRERYPEVSVYNRLCDLEWDTPVGQALACGGDAVMRTSVLQRVGGYRDSLVAGEEPELCVRVRQAGWQVWRLDADMTLHDAAMTRFGQWWRRTERAGHAFAEGAWLHGAPPERHWVRQTRSAVVWGAVLPAVALGALPVYSPLTLAIAVLYAVQWIRMAINAPGPLSLRVARASTLLLGKFAEALGAARFALRVLRGGPVRLIEYK